MHRLLWGDLIGVSKSTGNCNQLVSVLILIFRSLSLRMTFDRIGSHTVNFLLGDRQLIYANRGKCRLCNTLYSIFRGANVRIGMKDMFSHSRWNMEVWVLV